MKHWWVNHKQTFKEEYKGGYIWSPKANKNGSKNQTYLNLTSTSLRDRIYSYASGKIQCVGVIEAGCEDSPTPKEFGKTGEQWDKDGYLVRVTWIALQHPISPKDYIYKITPLLPKKYSPIQKNGNGNQSCYLSEISSELSELLIEIAKRQNDYLTGELSDAENYIIEEMEERGIENLIIPDTEKEQLRKSRIGQGIFRDEVVKIEGNCRLTGVGQHDLLIASHIKPWRDASSIERLDGNNGLLLSPHIDKLFDKGYISFQDDGVLMVSNQLSENLILSWGICKGLKTRNFNKKQRVYLKYHRENIYIC